MAHELSRPHIRIEKPGYSESYYDLAENLDDYATMLMSHLRLKPHQLAGGPGETGAILKVFTSDQVVIVKIGVWDGELFTSNLFYEVSRASGVPVPQVWHYDDSKRVIPFEFQVLEFIDGVDVSHLPLDLRWRAGQLVGKTLKQVHHIEVDGFGAPLPQGGWSASSWLAALRDTYVDSSLERKRNVFLDDIVFAIEAETIFNEQLEATRPCLIHSDVGPGNGLYRLRGDELQLVGFIDPGPIIGGDPMVDLPGGDDAFTRGIADTYGPLSMEEHHRLDRYRLFFSYWTACWQFATGRAFEATKRETLNRLEMVRRTS